MDIHSCPEQGETVWPPRLRVKLGGKPHAMASPNTAASLFFRRPVAAGHSCPSYPSLQNLPLQRWESKVLHRWELFGIIYLCPDKVGDHCREQGKMKLNISTIPLWDGVSLRKLMPAIEQGFALQPFPFGFVLATSLASEVPVTSSSLWLIISSEWEQSTVGGPH